MMRSVSTGVRFPKSPGFGRFGSNGLGAAVPQI